MLEKLLYRHGRYYIILIFSIISILTLLLSSKISFNFFNNGIGIVFGIILMFIAIPFYILGSKSYKFFITSILLNSLGNGLSISAYYLENSLSIDNITMFSSAILSIFILLITYLLLEKTSIKRILVFVIIGILDLGILAVSAYLWSKVNLTLFSYLFFTLLLSFFYMCIFVISIENDIEILLRNISFGSFGAFIILTLVVIFLLSYLDDIDSFNFTFSSIERKRTKKKKKNNDLYL